MEKLAENIHFYKLHKSLVWILLFIIISCSKFTGDKENDEDNNWDIVQINILVPLIADIRNDGIERSYAIEGGGWLETEMVGLFEYNFADGKWVKTELLTNSFYSSDPLIAAQCHEDGKFRLYGWSADGIFEVEYMNNIWSYQHICSTDDRDPGTWSVLSKGDARNDGFESLFILYFISNVGKLCELSHRDGTWKLSTIDDNVSTHASMPSGPNGLAVGNVGRDIGNSIYIITGKTYLIEYFFTNESFWQRSVLDTLYDLPPNTVLGPNPCIGVFPTRNGQSSLFATANGLHEFFFKEDHWEKAKIGQPIGHNIEGGMGRNDGIYRLYCYGWFGEIDEFTNNNGSWSQTDLIKIEPGSALSRLTVGPGRGDGIHRIYVKNGYTSELTFKR